MKKARLRILPIRGVCACGCGREFVQTVAGPERRYYRDHAHKVAHAKEKRKRRASGGPLAVRRGLLESLGR